MAGSFEVEGWKAIAETVGRGEAACRRYALRADDPLPVYQQLGRTVARRADLMDWVERQSVRRAS
jgi:hypothetical protein